MAFLDTGTELPDYAGVVEVRIPAIAQGWLKPAPVSLLDGGPVGGHMVLVSRGRWVNRRVVASVDAATAERAAAELSRRFRGMAWFFVGLLVLFLAMLVASALASARHYTAPYVIMAVGSVVCLVLLIRGGRGERRRRAELPLTIREERGGAVVVGPVHPAAAEAWASVNPPGSMTIVGPSTPRARGPIEYR